jgi:hypothetical protein
MKKQRILKKVKLIGTFYHLNAWHHFYHIDFDPWMETNGRVRILCYMNYKKHVFLIYPWDGITERVNIEFYSSDLQVYVNIY